MKHVPRAAWLPMLFLAAVAAPDVRAATFKGPFDFGDGVTFYLVNRTGAAFSLDLSYTASWHRKSMPWPLLVRVFDPDENVLARHFLPGEPVGKKRMPVDKIALEVPGRGAGVYQVVVSGYIGTVDIRTRPALPFGVYGHTQWLCARRDQFANAYVYLPPRLAQWKVTCKGAVEELTVADDRGKRRLSVRGKNPSGTMKLPAKGEHVWRFSAKSKGAYKLDFDGVPIILCPDEGTARAIHASVDVLDDGTICFHKFQVRIHEILKRYRSLPLESYAVTPPALEKHKKHWLEQPARNSLLFGAYGTYANLPPVLHEQNLDSQSPWFGTVHVWHDKTGQARKGNPWADYKRLGLTLVAGGWTRNLAMIYALDKPFNPLHKNPALLNRAIIGALQDLMLLKEHESSEPKPGLYYGGGRAFTFCAATTAFPRVIRDCPDDVRKVWTEGLRRWVDRYTVSQCASCTNQWSFIWVGFACFHKGTGEKWYADVLRRHLRWLTTCAPHGLGQRPAGYMTEACGPDATYNGITTHNLAWVYHEMKDPAMLESLRRCYSLFNHTIAPEPDGTWLGASDFCCRTPGTWVSPQHGAGLAMMGDDLPEAGIRADRAWLFPKPPGTAEELDAARKELSRRFFRYNPKDFARRHPANPGRIGGSVLQFRCYEHFCGTLAPGRLPMVGTDRFTRSIGGEFFSVRRPAYYVLLHAANTKCSWVKEPDDPNTQWPRCAGGISLFWSPRLGTSILGKNYSTHSAHSLVAKRAAGKPRWEDYRKVKATLETDPAVLCVTGRVRDVPLAYRRTWRFEDDRIVAELVIKADKAVALDSLAECFPYPLKKANPLAVKLLDRGGGPAAGGQAQAIQFGSQSPDVHLVVFATPRRCDVGVHVSVDHYKNTHRYGRVLAHLPAEWKAGQRRTFRYWIVPTGARNVTSTLSAVLNSAAR